MKTQKLNLKGAAILFTMLSMSVSVTQCTELQGMEEGSESDDLTSESISQQQELGEEEISGILFMREEEKLARDVYLYLYEIHPLRPFLNISKSEQAHMDAIKYLIDTYKLIDPVGDNLPGVFQNEELQELYDELIEKGSKSREEALKVGALIEEVDIIDLQTELEETAKNEDVIRVFTNLCSASENHLRAFVRVLALYDVDYEPVLLEQEEFDRILEN
ncbi:MAG: DUF2202 domain-containing protein [Bacteroidota bacterium]